MTIDAVSFAEVNRRMAKATQDILTARRRVEMIGIDTPPMKARRSADTRAIAQVACMIHIEAIRNRPDPMFIGQSVGTNQFGPAFCRWALRLEKRIAFPHDASSPLPAPVGRDSEFRDEFE